MSCDVVSDESVEDGDDGVPTVHLLVAALVLVGFLGVCLNALVIMGVRQAVIDTVEKIYQK
jgi:hypothetical protein